MRLYAFFAHFNRVNMQRGDPRVWTVHFRGTCYQVTGIIFRNTTVTTRYVADGPQPRATLRGSAFGVHTTEEGFAVVE